MFSRLLDNSGSLENSRSGDEHDAAIWEFYDMVASSSAAKADSDYESEDEEESSDHQVGPLNKEQIRSSQQSDRFSRQMAGHLQSAC